MRSKESKKSLYKIAVFVLVILAGANVYATTISQTQTFSGTPNMLKTFTFDYFNNMGGTRTLNSVYVSFNLDADGGSLVLDNDAATPASGTFEFGVNATLFSTDVALVNSTFQPLINELQAIYSGGFSLAANVGDSSNDFDPTGPDGMQYFGGSESDSGFGYVNSFVLSQYIGSGTYQIKSNVTQWQDFGGSGAIEWAVSPSAASGSLTVVYDYTVVPEPATIILLGLGSLTTLLRKVKA